MWVIILYLAAGVTLGSLLKMTEKIKAINGKAQFIGLMILLFSMGVSIGANDEIVNNLHKIGLKALLFGLSTSFGSILLVFIVSRRFFKKGA